MTEAGPHNPTRAAVAAGALFTDTHGRIMLVHPTYKDYWDIPGGYVEPGETPYQACVREVAEELGIRPAIGPLLAVDWAPGLGDGDKVLFIFDGGQLTDSQHAAIQLQDNELSEYAYLDLDAIAERTIHGFTGGLPKHTGPDPPPTRSTSNTANPCPALPSSRPRASGKPFN